MCTYMYTMSLTMWRSVDSDTSCRKNASSILRPRGVKTSATTGPSSVEFTNFTSRARQQWVLPITNNESNMGRDMLTVPKVSAKYLTTTSSVELTNIR
mmetsp:Transcript_1173/g.2068  ORF Transcript_1173/g.2068 Transcript_1173/m.2068 type:complete len:98 (+) Transcript_1173:3531-3824(+)